MQAISPERGLNDIKYDQSLIWHRVSSHNKYQFRTSDLPKAIIRRQKLVKTRVLSLQVGVSRNTCREERREPERCAQWRGEAWGAGSVVRRC